MRVILQLLLLLSLVATSARAQATDIVGAWVLDPARSDKPLFEPPTNLAPSAVTGPTPRGLVADATGVDIVTIAQVGDELSVTRRLLGNLAAPLDGPERLTSTAGTTVRTRAWREGGGVVVLTVKGVQLPGGRVSEVRVTERFVRAPDGSLTHERTLENEGVTRTWRFVYQPAR